VRRRLAGATPRNLRCQGGCFSEGVRSERGSRVGNNLEVRRNFGDGLSPGREARRRGNKLPRAKTPAAADVVIRVFGRVDSEYHALRFAGDCAESIGVRQSKQGIAENGAQARTALRAGRFARVFG